MGARRPWSPAATQAPRPPRKSATRTHPPRALALTDKAYAALGVSRPVAVPLVDLPWRPDEKDRREENGRV